MLPKAQVSAKNVLITGKELFLGLIVGSIWWPIYTVLFILNVSLRTIVQYAYDFFHAPGTYTVADGEDSLFGHRVKGNCNSLIQGYQIIKGTPNLSIIRQKYQNLLQSPETKKEYSRLGCIFTHKWGYFCWEKDAKFDIRRHVKVLDNWDITKEADEEKLMDIVSELVTKDMSTDKPQWEILLVPRYWTGVSGQPQHYAVITRFNHAYSDAISYFLMINNYIADAKADLPLDPTKLPFKVPVWALAILWAKALLLGPYSFVSIMYTYIFDKSVFSMPYYSEKKLCGRSPPIPLDSLKNIKKCSGASITAILCTAIYAALEKAHLRDHKFVKVPEILHLGSVMAMFPYWEGKNSKLSNQFTLWPYFGPLAVKGGCLQERLRISDEMCKKGLGSCGPLFNFHLSRSLGSVPRMFHRTLWTLSGCPVMLSNVPGFSSQLKIYGGEMVDGSGFLPLMSTVGVGLSTQTYCGELRLNCIVDPKVFSRRPQLQLFLNDIISELEQLSSMYQVPQKPLSKSVLDKDENANLRTNRENLEIFMKQAIS